MASSDRKSGVTKQRYSIAPDRQLKPKVSLGGNNLTASPAFVSRTKPNSRLSETNMEESNISVFVRCRSRNDREIKENSGVVVSTLGHMGKEVVLQTGPMSVSNKTYTFDRVFGAESDQEMVYEGIAQGVLKEMLQGYNCTVFAYGQTGTGKTYTMSGDIKTTGDRLSDEAGIIPRTLVELFKSLQNSADFSVKVSFIELYNEELRDLLANSEIEERKVRIFEDPTKKSIVVQGMEEVFIKDATEGMKVLADGSYKRQVAATQCNDLSSRSHSVFTITVHLKETDPISGQEYLKIGKLNLVDLAGSENISRSGAENKRAREAGMINQSLLTLGRVINSLVDQSPHVPYRESKLTRLLQDSLGGKTKTCIIATISPAKVSIEETISTLEYANRAKSIKNKPQVNQTMSKKMLIKEYVQEIERLRNDLTATRSRNGIYVTEENWQQVTSESESRRIQVEEQKLRMSVLEEQLKKFKKDFEENINHIKEVEAKIEKTEQSNKLLQSQVLETTHNLRQTESELKIEKLMNEEHEKLRKEVESAYGTVTSILEDVLNVKDSMHDIIDQKNNLELTNYRILKSSKTGVLDKTKSLSKNVHDFQNAISNLSTLLNTNFTNMVQSQQQKIQNRVKVIISSSEKIDKAVQTVYERVKENSDGTNKEVDHLELLKSQIKDEIIREIGYLKDSGENFTDQFTSTIKDTKESIKSGLNGLGNHVKQILDVTQAQLDAQSLEIISLKDKLLEHQKKYDNLLNQQEDKLLDFKELENGTSALEKETLVQKISLLIDEHEKSKLKRLEDKVDTINPELRNIRIKHQEFTKNLEGFILNNWALTQSKFKEQLESQNLSIKSTISDLNEKIHQDYTDKFITPLQSHQLKQDENLLNTISNLDNKMLDLNKFASFIKSLNQKNLEFTGEQLKSINITASSSLRDLGLEFAKFGKELNDSKPDLVDSFLSKQDKVTSDFKEKTISELDSLSTFVGSIKYTKDDQQIPKRQKLEIQRNLPKKRTRDEIISVYRDEIYKEETSGKDDLASEDFIKDELVEDPSLVPVPDKLFKQPLAKSNKDLNIITNASQGTKVQAVSDHLPNKKRPSSFSGSSRTSSRGSSRS